LAHDSNFRDLRTRRKPGLRELASCYVHRGQTTPKKIIYEGVVANCSLDISKGTGVCVAQKERLASSHTSIVTTTYTGSIIPLATITTSNGFQMAARNSVVVVGSAVLAGVLAGAALIFV